MTEPDKFLYKLIAGLFALIGVLLILTILQIWYTAGIQKEVYSRQGVEMTQWEIFMGAKPIVRPVIIKE